MLGRHAKVEHGPHRITQAPGFASDGFLQLLHQTRERFVASILRVLARNFQYLAYNLGPFLPLAIPFVFVLAQLVVRYAYAPTGQLVALSLDGDFIEAEAWGYLAVRSLRGLPLTFPTTTGCRQPVSGGVLVPAR